MVIIKDSVYRVLERHSGLLHEEYSKADPFPHTLLRDIINPSFLNRCEKTFPSPEVGKWWRYENELEKKLARNDLHNFPQPIKHLVQELLSKRFVTILEGITGIKDLIVDYTLNGGGLHQIIRGGKLDIHADYNFHPTTRLDRRVNLLLYLNPEWRSEWKGDLELWDRDMTKCVESYEPFTNRMVIFSTSDVAYHGHPDPLECPEGMSRRSIALYYYTNGRTDQNSAPHSTVFKRRPQDPEVLETEELRTRRAIRRITV